MDDYVAKPIGTPALAACLARGRVLLPVQASFGGSVAAQAPLRVAVEPVDLEVLSASYGTDAVASRAMLEDFVEINAQDLEALLVALRERDARRVARQAHRMQGASKMVGAASLARIAARLESRAPDLDWSRIAALASVLAGECRRVERFVATSLRVSDPCRPRAGGRRSVDERLRLFPHVLL
jgi:HPt (histidine-containing phosphotransfer) domain-containing protein